MNKIINLQTRILGSGSAALSVSCIGFGAMGMTHHRGPIKDRNQMIALLHEAKAAGVTLFDTAEIYGPYSNECLVGDSFGNDPDVIIATKFGHKISNGQAVYGALDSTPDTIRRSCEGSLKRLKRESIDLYYQHRVDPKVPIEVVAETVKELISEGKVRRFGLSEASPETIRRAHKILPVTAVQSEFHLMWRKPEDTVFPLVQELGIGFVAYSPLNRGYLTGSMDAHTHFSPINDNRCTLPRFTSEALEKNHGFVDLLEEFGAKHNLTQAQVQLAWTLWKAPWIVPIPGSTQEAHMLENLLAANARVCRDDWKALEDEAAKIKIYGDRYGAVEQAQAS